MQSPVREKIRFSHPGTYHVRVLGSVSKELWDFFTGELENVSVAEDGQVIYALKFQVRDQVELSGLIDLLFRRGHVLLSVQREDQTGEKATKT